MSERGRPRPLLVVLGILAGLGASLALLRRLDAVEVSGSSMAPTLLPGDRLLIESLSYGLRSPRCGEVVLVRDPRQRSRELIKRVVGRDGDALDLHGDAPSDSTDSRTFGAVPAVDVHWRAVVRYWPPQRAGRLAARPVRP